MHDETAAPGRPSAPNEDKPAAEAALARLREQVVECDRRLVGVVNQRRTLVQAIGDLKRRLGLPVTDPAREAAVVRRAAEIARAEGVDEELVRDLVWKIIAWARDEQARQRER